MKLTKFIIPLSISLGAFVWGYRGELWFGKIDSNIASTQLSEPEKIENKRDEPLERGSGVNNYHPSANTYPSEPLMGKPPIEPKELPLLPRDDSEQYAPEDDGQNPDGDTEEVDIDPEEDQVLSVDEPGADNSENEEVDSDSNEGDLEGDETADTAETKPVKP